MLKDQSLLIACKDSNQVLHYSNEGAYLGEVTGDREFECPRSVCRGSYGFLVQDNNGLQRFLKLNVSEGFLGEKHFNRYLGITVDDKFHTITLNINKQDEESLSLGPGVASGEGQTDIFYIDDLSGKVIKRVNLVHVIAEQDQLLSQCVDVCFKNEALYLVDQGLNCLYRFTDDEVFRFGENAGLNNPSAIVADEFGAVIVADSGNNRLVLFDKDLKFCGNLSISQKISINGPSDIYFDKNSNEFYVCFSNDNKVVCLQ